MSLISRQFAISGMTCVNCENKIQKKLNHAAGVKEAVVSYNTGMAQITFESDIISFEQITGMIEELDYEVLPEEEQGRFDISRTVSFLAIIIALYVLLQQFGILNLLVPSQLADSGMGYGMLFVVGVLTSVHCIAMCGGINLSQCIPRSETQNDNIHGAAAFVPPVLYNFGRVISYTLIGFVLGLVGMLLGGGSGIGISTFVQGILKLIAGVFMVIMGINMLGIFPWLRKWNPRIPRFLAVKVSRKRMTSTQPFVIGLLNGLMPCGPLQSMQIIALASANPMTGAFSMFLFSLGTVPLMLGLGSLVSAIGRKFARSVMSVGAVLVVVLGLAIFFQGGNLSGLLPAGRMWQYFHTEEAGLENSKVQIVDGVQVVNSTLASGRYPIITVQAGLPVKWIINAGEGSINGCNYRMIIQDYGIEYSFHEGENVIEFTPTDVGTVPYTCWMGMIQGDIIVVKGEV